MLNNNIGMQGSAEAVDQQDIEQAIGEEKFPGLHDFVDFYRRNNGGKPSKTAVLGDVNPTIRYFFSIKSRFHPKVRTLEEANVFYRNKIDFSAFFLDKLIFGNDEGGNLYCIDSKNGSVLFVPMDMGRDLDAEKVLIAGDFAAFIGKLTSYSEVFE